MSTGGTTPILADPAGYSVVSGRASNSGYPVFLKLVVAVAVSLLGVRVALGPNITPGLMLSVLLLPVWWGHLTGSRLGRIFVWLCLGSVISGLVLAELHTPSHKTVSSSQLTVTVLMISLLSGVGVVLWARTYYSVGRIGLYFGAGLVANALINGNQGLASDNPLKFTWALPICVVLLSACATTASLKWDALALVALCGALTIVDARALFGTSLLAIVLVVWQLRPRVTSRRSSWVWTAALLVSVGIGVYQIGVALLVDGALGQDAQQRSIQQIDTSGSLLLGGRPELGATLALMRYEPFGLGAGVAATGDEISVAKQGMASLNYDPNNGYVDHYIFGAAVVLHSVFGDLWANFGLIGLTLAGFIAFVVLRSIALTIAGRAGRGLLMLVGIFTGWNLLFSPLFAATATLIVTLGMMLPIGSARPRRSRPSSTDERRRDVPAMVCTISRTQTAGEA